MIEASGSTKSLVLPQVLDGGELRKFVAPVVDEGCEYMLFIVTDQENLFDGRLFGQGPEGVPDYWVTGNIKEWLVRVGSSD